MDCPVCLQPLAGDPTTLPCGHSLCMGCLAQFQSETCAECRTPFVRSQQRPSLALRTLLLREKPKEERSSWWAALWNAPPSEATPCAASSCAVTPCAASSWRAYVRHHAAELNDERDERAVARLCRLIHDQESDGDDPTNWTKRITGMHDDLILSGLHNERARTAVVVATQVAKRQGRFGDDELLSAVRAVMRRK